MKEAAKAPGKKLTVKSGAEGKTIPAYPDRSALIISNTGEKDVTYALGSSATAGEGPVLKEKGGSVILEGYGGPVSFVTASGETTVGYTEF